MQRICNLLADNNFAVHLICRESGGLPENLFREQIIFHQLSSTALIKKIIEIKKILKDVRPDYVHVHGIFKDAFIPGLTFKRFYKYYITFWGSDLNLFSRKPLNKLFQNIAILWCDKIHLLSEHFSRQIQTTYFNVNPKKIEIFSWGIDFACYHNPDPTLMQNMRTKLKIKPSDPVILSHRNHKELYNHHTTIRSMASVIKAIPNARFIFTKGNADDDYVQKTLSLVREQKLEENFIFIDHWFSDVEMSALVNLAKVCVNIPFTDGLPATLFEIMATKAIPIVSSLDNYRSFFQDGVNGFYLKNINDPEELAIIITKAIENYTEISPKIYQCNNQYIMKYHDWKINSKKQVDLYD